jgi:hypothetical protein
MFMNTGTEFYMDISNQYSLTPKSRHQSASNFQTHRAEGNGKRGNVNYILFFFVWKTWREYVIRKTSIIK